jgi:hypothetical protein
MAERLKIFSRTFSAQRNTSCGCGCFTPLIEGNVQPLRLEGTKNEYVVRISKGVRFQV